MSILIRKEQTSDIPAIHKVTQAAFANAPHTDHTEHFIVNALRQAQALSLSLVAEENQQVIGHVALSAVRISDGSANWYGLAPVSVAPSHQGKGIGTQLINAAITELKSWEANGCVLLGDPHYYQRFGFAAHQRLVLQGVPPEYFQALLLNGELPQGEVAYHVAFSATC